MSIYGISNLNSNEHISMMLNISESLYLQGTTCKYYACKSYTRDINNDPVVDLSTEPIELEVSFESNPRPILKKMNWLAEDDELPYIANMSSIVFKKYKEWKESHSEEDHNKIFTAGLFNTDGTIKDEYKSFMIPINPYSVLEFDYAMPNFGSQKFTITNIVGDSVSPFYWICKLVPHRDLSVEVDLSSKYDEKKDNHDSDYDYLKVKVK